MWQCQLLSIPEKPSVYAVGWFFTQVDIARFCLGCGDGPSCKEHSIGEFVQKLEHRERIWRQDGKAVNE